MQQLHAYWRMEYIEAPRYPASMKRPFTELIGKRLLAKALKPEAFNVGFNLGPIAGGSIAHLHAHIVPRWGGDNNFMPVIGHTRLLPQSLAATWERLAAAAGGKNRKIGKAGKRKT